MAFRASIDPPRMADRSAAGRQLADELAERQFDDPVVFALPRGGVPVGFEIAERLDAPLDVLVVRKIGAPMNPELAIGAVGEGGARVAHPRTMESVGVSEAEFERQSDRARSELERLVERLRGERPPVDPEGREVILVDDGMATGSTAEVAAKVLRQRGARRVVLAVPVASREAVELLTPLVDEIVAAQVPVNLYAVGAYFEDFSPVSSDDVIELLHRSSGFDGHRSGDGDDAHPLDGAGALSGHVVLSGDDVELEGDLNVPSDAIGVVLFAHGSGSSRLSPRNRAVAAALNRSGLATLLFDLLTEREAADRANVFDIELLAERLASATAWLREQPGFAELPVGYFGASTGAAAALIAAAERGADVAAVVSRGGRPDLAESQLPAVVSPTLLIVGSLDTQVLELNERAAALLACEHELSVVPGATHLFEEPGTLEAVSELARDWFAAKMAPDPG